MPTREQVRGAVDAYVDAYNRNDRQAFLEAFARAGVVIDPVGTPPHSSLEARGAFWDLVHSMTEQITLVPHEIHVCGDEAAMVFTIEARTGDSGTRIAAVETFAVDDAGKITQLKAYWDLTQATPLGH